MKGQWLWVVPSPTWECDWPEASSHPSRWRGGVMLVWGCPLYTGTEISPGKAKQD